MPDSPPNGGAGRSGHQDPAAGAASLF